MNMKIFKTFKYEAERGTVNNVPLPRIMMYICECLSRIKKDYIREHMSEIRYMQNETKIPKFIFCQFTGGRKSHPF